MRTGLEWKESNVTKYKCVGIIDQTGKSSFDLVTSALVFLTVDSGFDPRLGRSERINLRWYTCVSLDVGWEVQQYGIHSMESMVSSGS